MRDEVIARPLEPLTDAMPPLTVLYDGGCSFCRWTVGHLRRWDRDQNLRIQPYQTTRAEPILADLLEGHSLGRSIHVVDSAGRVATGEGAVLAVVALLPGGRPVAGLISAIPPSRFAMRLGYRLVDRLRGQLASLFGLDGPHLHERNPSFEVLGDPTLV